MADVIQTVCGLFGDGGKGTTVESCDAEIADPCTTVVRHNGGAQAVHFIVRPDGRVHGFSQFGSASFRPDVQTHLSRFMLIYPTSLLEEAEELKALGVADVLERLTIHRDAPIITPYHRAANWLREMARNSNQHGTCGMGIGEVMQDLEDERDDMLFADDLDCPGIIGPKVARIRHRKRQELRVLISMLPTPYNALTQTALDVLDSDEAYMTFVANCKRVGQTVRIVGDDFLRDVLARPGLVISEGAQGVLLDEWYGFHPHTTWSTTTFANIDTLLAEAGWNGHATKFVVFRAYATRHGAGPLVTHDAALTAALPEMHNREDGWQGNFRCGWFDLVAARYSLAVLGRVDGIALTCLDRIEHLNELPICVAYRYTGTATVTELRQYFTIDDSATGAPRITGIRVGKKGDLEYQGALTAHLFQCVPEYDTVCRSGLVTRLETELRVPIVSTSHGPTVNDKQYRIPLRSLLHQQLAA